MRKDKRMAFLKSKKFVLSILIFITAVAVLAPTLTNIYLYDDEFFIKDNEAIRSVNNVPDYFSRNVYGEKLDFDPIYRPIYLVSLYLNQLLLGHKAISYHLINLLLHAIVSILLFLVLARFYRDLIWPFLIAIIFSVHTVHTESVAFIHYRSDILALFFILLGFLICTRDRAFMSIFKFEGAEETSVSPGHFLLMSLFFFLALLSKETVLAFMGVFLIFALIKRDRNGPYIKNPSFLYSLSGFLAVAIIYFSIRFFAVGTMGGAQSELTFFQDRSFVQIFTTMSRVFMSYIGMLFFPYGLKIDYFDLPLTAGFQNLSVIVSILIHGALLVFAFVVLKKRPLISICIFSFYILLLPVSHILPFFDVKACRFLYIPSMFFSILLVTILKEFNDKPSVFKPMLVLIGIFVLMLSWLTFDYSIDFRSKKALFTKMVQMAPGNVKFQMNLGLYYLWDEKDFAKAAIALEKAIKLRPDYPKPYSGLAISYFNMGNIQKAHRTFVEGLAKDKNYMPLNLNYAVFNHYLGNKEEAFKYLAIAKTLALKFKRGLAEVEKVEREIRR